MSGLVLTVLCLALVAALGWWLGTLVAVWNNRPIVMWDAKTKHWRAHRLIGTPWRTRRHGVTSRKPLERRSNVTTLEQPALEQSPTQRLDITA